MTRRPPNSPPFPYTPLFRSSGDLSHRLTPGAPAGFHPEAHRFDEEVVEAIRARVPERVVNIDQGLRRLAGECGYRSMRSEEHTSELQSQSNLVCRLLLEKKT